MKGEPGLEALILVIILLFAADALFRHFGVDAETFRVFLREWLTFR